MTIKDIACLVWCLVLCQTAYADGIIPFDSKQSSTKSDISRMKCSQFNGILQDAGQQNDKAKISLSEIIIWTHGVISGMSGSAQPFSKDFATGSAVILATRCSKYPNETLYGVIKSVAHQK